MSYDTSNPGDSDQVSQFPGNERALRAFLQTIMAVDHETGAGATQGYHKLVHMLSQTGIPTAIGGGIIYAKVFESNAELYYLDSSGNDIRLTYKGELAVNLQQQEIIVNSLRTRTFFRGRALDLEIVGGATAVDWEAATLFRLTVTEDVTVTVENMPDVTSEEEQTVLFEVINGGNHTITLESDYTLLWKEDTGPTWTENGRDLAIATSHDGSNILAAIVPDFGTGV